MLYASAMTYLNASRRTTQRPMGIVELGLWLSVPWQPRAESAGPPVRDVFGLTDATSNERSCAGAVTARTSNSASATHFMKCLRTKDDSSMTQRTRCVLGPLRS